MCITYEEAANIVKTTLTGGHEVDLLAMLDKDELVKLANAFRSTAGESTSEYFVEGFYENCAKWRVAYTDQPLRDLNDARNYLKECEADTSAKAKYRIVKITNTHEVVE